MSGEVVVCSAGCKRSVELPQDGTTPPGWEQLQITNRWRCMQCYRELDAGNSMQGTQSAFTPDPLPADSIGALKKLPDAPPLHEKVKP